MAKTTITDIARATGLSTATVDRALNGRGGCSALNRQRVFRAARELGYLPSEDGIVLPSRPAHLEFFIPSGRNLFMDDLANRIRRVAAALPMVATCKITALQSLDPDAQVAALDGVDDGTDGVGLIAVDHPKTQNAIRRLEEAGVAVVTIASDVLSTPRRAYVGIDNVIAGRIAARIMGLMARPRRGKIALFLGTQAFCGHRQREDGFRTLLDEQFPGLAVHTVVETREENTRSHPQTRHLLRTLDDLVGIYCVGAGRAGIVAALSDAGPKPRCFVIMHDLTEATRGWLAGNAIDVVIDQNAQLVGKQAVIQLLGSIAAPSSLLPARPIESRIIFRENIPPA